MSNAAVAYLLQDRKPRPLEPTRQLPATPVNPLKRSVDGDDKQGEKRARARAMLTPPSSDGHVPSDDVGFKVPAIPQRIRLMTPSSSTVAASSSPAPFSSPDSRKRTSNETASSVGEVIEIEIEQGLTYVFGRHRHHNNSINSNTTLPPSLSASLSQPDKPIRNVFLPRTASQASRLHAVAEYLSETNELRLVVAGQNGLRFRSQSLNRRVRKGESITVKRSDEGIKLNFYGCTALLRLPTPNKSHELPGLFSPSSSPVRPSLASLPPSSPPLGPVSDDEEGGNKSVAQSDRSSSPLSPLIESAPLDLDEVQIKAEALDSVSKTPAETSSGSTQDLAEMQDEIAVAAPTSSSQRPVSRAATPVKEVPPVPANVDLPALIASTVVFSGSSKLSQPDLVKHMLEVSS